MFRLMNKLCIYFIVILFIEIGVNSIDVETPPLTVKRIEDQIQPLAEDEIITYRLPNTTKPETYNVTLQTWVHEGNLTFIGHIDIGLLALETTDRITIHHRQLNILSVQLLFLNIPFDCVWEYDIVTEFLVIYLPISMIINNSYIVKIDYSGTLRNDEAGFYVSSYINDSGERRYLATTQFESTDARHAFPCYDEPALKANFTISITHNITYSAISNMPEIQHIANPDGTVTTSFETTPPTSTYLIAFLISDFAYNGAFYQIPHRAFARQNAINETNLTLNSGIQILTALEEFLQVNYSLPKMDQAAIPDFAAGAMENWGLVTYRESGFFYNPSESTYTTKVAIVRVIAHEFVHQWFGNLVSPTWWTYLWLNEGFASYFANFIADKVHPDWHLADNFVVSTLQNVFISDASASTRPMSYYVESPSAIERLFDNIAYDKSGSVLRMFMNALTTETFRQGLNYYLNDRAYSNATEEDLFAGIERAAKEDGTLSEDLYFPTIMRSWTQQSGFPIVYVQRHYDEGSMTISQEQFLTYPTSSLSSTTFWIPLNFATAQNPDFSTITVDYWLPQNKRFIRIEQNSNNGWNDMDWIVFNKQQAGYYRVQYDRRNWNLIAQALYENYNQIHLLSRSQLIDDSFTFARTNRLGWDIAFNILRYLENEIEYVPWVSATRHLNYLNRFITGLDNYDLYKIFIANLTENLFENIGIEDIEDEPILRKYARTLVINWSCTFGSEMCRTQTNNRIKDYITDGRVIHQNLRSVMYCAGLRMADENDYYYFWNRMIMTSDSQLTTALGCISNITLLADYLENSLNLEISASIRQGIFNAVYQNSHEGYTLASQYLIDNFNQSTIIFTNNNNLGNGITGIAQRATSKHDIDQVEILIQLASNSGIGANYITTANNNILQNIQWTITNSEYINDWLLANVL